MEYATFGAGCFWGVQAIFSKTNGVVTAQVGYCGGKTIDPTYEQISLGNTGHAETVQVKFDNTKVSYQELLDLFWRLHDPTTLNSQGHDIGSHYRSVIFYHDQKQAEIALEMKNLLDSSGKLKTKIVTEVTAFTTFFLGEEYHQDYYEKKYQGELGPICHFVRGE
ncbi:MAG: peptide-methionine (S)-S-oxide reductase MsrA [Halobacteriovoraceae bacterium]|nr:peptide-methionine (S)-S-oxide reductase MsrA [Halobacteriovoraceae bacterium]